VDDIRKSRQINLKIFFVVLEEISVELPPIHDIHHAINLVLDAVFPTKLAY